MPFSLVSFRKNATQFGLGESCFGDKNIFNNILKDLSNIRFIKEILSHVSKVQVNQLERLSVIFLTFL